MKIPFPAGLFVLMIAASPIPAGGGEVLTWDQVAEEASKNNPDLEASRAAVERARFQQIGSYGPFLPQLSLNAGYDRTGFETSTGVMDQTGNYSLGLTLTQSLFSGFRDQAGLDRAGAELEAAEAEYLSVRAEVAFDLKTAFAQMLYAQDQIDLARANLSRRRENLDLVRLRFEAGREHKGSFLRSEAAHHEAEFEVAQSVRALEVARRQLARAMGRRSMGEARVSGAFDVTPPPEAPDFGALARQTPAYRLPAAQARSAEADVTASRSGFFPELRATGTVSRGGENFPPERDQWTAGLLLTLPLFSGGSDYYGVQGARSGYRRAQESLQSADEQAILDLESRHADFLNSIERVRVRQDFLAAGEVRAQIARGLYATGLLSFENWDPIENELIAARKDMLAGLRDRMAAEAAWERAQGRGAVR